MKAERRCRRRRIDVDIVFAADVDVDADVDMVDAVDRDFDVEIDDFDVAVSTQKFKWPKNRKDASDFDDFWMKLMASTQTFFFKKFCDVETICASMERSRGTNDDRTTDERASEPKRTERLTFFSSCCQHEFLINISSKLG